MTVLLQQPKAWAVWGLSAFLVALGMGCGSTPAAPDSRALGNFANSNTSNATGSTDSSNDFSGTGGLSSYMAPTISPTATGGMIATDGTDASVGDMTGAPDGDQTCGGVEVEPMVETVVVPGNVLIVFDESLSMNENWGSGQSKWVAASQAMISALTPLQDQINAATIFFPTSGGLLGCGVDAIDSGKQINFLPGPDFIAAWNTYMSSHGPSGMTPLGTAMQMADSALANANLVGNTAVVVITDGDPNCGTDDTQVNQYATNWLANDIETHVVGLPGIGSGATRLNTLATSGGTGQYLEPTDATALQTALSSIATNAVSTTTDYCNITLPEPPPDPSKVTLAVVENGVQQAVDMDLGTGGGWSMDTTTWQITLFGNLCDQAMAGNYEKVSVVFGCISLPPLPPPEPPVLK